MYKSWMWKQRSYREQFQGDEGGGSAGGSGAEQQQDDQQQAADETSEGQQPDDQQGQGDAENDEIVIAIGDEAPPVLNDDEIEGKPAPAWVKELRKENRELKKRQREIEQAEAARQAAAAPKVDPIGEKPTPEQFDYDSEAYGEALLAWNDRKKKADESAAAARQAQEAEQVAWTKSVDAYRAAGAALKAGNFAEAEATVTAALNPTQQQIMVLAPDSPQDSARLVAALSRNPAELKKLADITNPVKYIVAVTKLVGKLKDVPLKQPPPAERAVRASAGGATTTNNELERLRAEADKTGDRSKVAAYLRKQKQAA